MGVCPTVWKFGLTAPPEVQHKTGSGIVRILRCESLLMLFPMEWLLGALSFVNDTHGIKGSYAVRQLD